MDPLSKIPKVRQVWQPAKSNLLRSIPGLAGLTSAKESLPVMKRPQTNLRRSKSFSELQVRKPISDRNGMVLHPMLPKGDMVKSSGSLAHSRDLAKSNGFLNQNKENKPFVRNTTTAVKRAGAPIAPIVAAKLPRNANVSANGLKSATVAKPAAVNKKIPLYDYKARFNDLLEKHKPMKEEYLELKRTRDTIEEELEEMRTQWESYAITLEEYKKNAEVDRSKINQLTNDNSQMLTKYELVIKENEELKARLGEITSELFYLKQTLEETSRKLNNSEEVNRQQEQLIAKQAADVEELEESTQKLHWERRSLHNKLQDMKGNIRVICRVRPALAAGKPVAAMSFPDACTIELERFEPGNRRLAKHDFKFDRVFGPSSNQEDVWEEVSCLVQSALDGYNVCIFAYGQTGSGKTFTMEGSGTEPGVIPRSCTMLFQSMKQLSKSGWEYTAHASFLEIYNEQLYDLLQPSRDPRELDIRMVDAKGSDVYVTNLTEQEVHTAEDLLRLVARAQLHRQTAATAGNERSSRSHSVARIRICGKHSGRELQLAARLCLVDLAGSESAKLTQRIKETKNINRSLSELGQVILALQQKQEHIPFRNSKLTRLLEPQLGGAAKALLVAAAAPYEDCSQESLSTLRFATQVGHCSTATARRNIALANPTAAPAQTPNKH